MDAPLIVNWLESGDTRGLYQKYCLMKSAARGEIVFRVRPKSAWVEFGLEKADLPFLKEGYSIFRVVFRGRSILVILDNKDSFFNISPLIRKADLYFLGAYSPAIIEGKCFPEPYSWQTETDLFPYRQHFQAVVGRYGDMFGKIVRSIPMPMVMHPALRRGSAMFSPARRFLTLAFCLTMDRWARRWHTPLPLVLERAMFSIRYEELLALRHQPLLYDIVAADTLWAWPDHRARLYHEIDRLPNQQRVVARLSAPRKGETWPDRVSPQMLAFVKGRLGKAQASFNGTFESMLASSKLNVFACGKHWGWRQICFISLLCGCPILMDRPVFTPYFSFDEFSVSYTRDQWQELPDLLVSLDENAWWRIKGENQKVFDRYLAPEAVSRYLLDAIKKKLEK